MKVWIDQNLCTGDGLCAQLAPSVFTMLEDGLAYVKDDGGPRVGLGEMVDVRSDNYDAVRESCYECPGECIFIEDDNE